MGGNVPIPHRIPKPRRKSRRQKALPSLIRPQRKGQPLWADPLMQPMRFDETRSEYSNSFGQRRTLRRGREFATVLAFAIHDAASHCRQRVRSRHHRAQVAPLRTRKTFAPYLQQLAHPKHHTLAATYAFATLRVCGSLGVGSGRGDLLLLGGASKNVRIHSTRDVVPHAEHGARHSGERHGGEVRQSQ